MNAATGKVLWTFNGPSIHHGGGSTSAPAVYTVHGRERRGPAPTPQGHGHCPAPAGRATASPTRTR